VDRIAGQKAAYNGQKSIFEAQSAKVKFDPWLNEEKQVCQ